MRGPSGGVGGHITTLPSCGNRASVQYIEPENTKETPLLSCKHHWSLEPDSRDNRSNDRLPCEESRREQTFKAAGIKGAGRLCKAQTGTSNHHRSEPHTWMGRPGEKAAAPLLVNNPKGPSPTRKCQNINLWFRVDAQAPPQGCYRGSFWRESQESSILNKL